MATPGLSWLAAGPPPLMLDTLFLRDEAALPHAHHGDNKAGSPPGADELRMRTSPTMECRVLPGLSTASEQG